ncbi:MAG: hypothetical protein IKS76_03885 [Paludibacteraceae bacterium]|nr:hypothetical protein [Paludibacteraceae bacterium]
MVKDDRKYHECMQLTSQVKFCPNAFRVDMYRGCDYGCRYCFANMEAFHETGTGLSMWRQADLEEVRKKFYLALETDKPSMSVIVELLRHRVPLHCGGMSDPFQRREWTEHLTKGLIEISNQYDYPICFSTKTASLPDDYYALLNPSRHAFQVSIMGWSPEYVAKWETNTPSPQSRAEFVQLLRNDFGLWCSVRIQPIINVHEAFDLMNALGDIPSYYSVEHLHVIADSYNALDALLEHCLNSDQFTQTGGVTEFKYEVKRHNAEQLIRCANKYGVKVGVADNDLHFMSQSRCCCGIDLIGGQFDNYLKYNSCYMSTGAVDDVNELWRPSSNVRRHMNIGARKPTVYVEDVVKKYILDHKEVIPDKYRENIERQLFGVSQRNLF